MCGTTVASRYLRRHQTKHCKQMQRPSTSPAAAAAPAAIPYPDSLADSDEEMAAALRESEQQRRDREHRERVRFQAHTPKRTQTHTLSYTGARTRTQDKAQSPSQAKKKRRNPFDDEAPEADVVQLWQWQCGACTLLNEPGRVQCKLCDEKRPEQRVSHGAGVFPLYVGTFPLFAIGNKIGLLWTPFQTARAIVVWRVRRTRRARKTFASYLHQLQQHQQRRQHHQRHHHHYLRRRLCRLLCRHRPSQGRDSRARERRRGITRA